jgi:hypothetical protein
MTATTATIAALTTTTIPYAVVSRDPSGTSTSAEATPVATTKAKSHAAAFP